MTLAGIVNRILGLDKEFFCHYTSTHEKAETEGGAERRDGAATAYGRAEKGPNGKGQASGAQPVVMVAQLGDECAGEALGDSTQHLKLRAFSLRTPGFTLLAAAPLEPYGGKTKGQAVKFGYWQCQIGRDSPQATPRTPDEPEYFT
jgi:hypothetical protein